MSTLMPISTTARKAWGALRWYTSAPGVEQIAMRARYYGFKVECPFCGWRGRAFYPHPEPHPRPNALCPRCWSKERHRLLHLYLKQVLEIEKRNLTVLEMAPGPYSNRLFKGLPNVTYLSLDLESTWAMSFADINHLPLSDQLFDLIICYHVLEHIPDDRGAMAELRRVLKPEGDLLVQVPIVCEVTEEDPTVVDPQERLLRFGQDDHVRNYGFDFYDRLRDAGFSVQLDDYAATLPMEIVGRYGIDPNEIITRCILDDTS